MESNILAKLTEFGVTPRVRVVILSRYGIDYKDHMSYPINFLRDLAIQNVITTHYIVIDPGTILSENLFAEFDSLPKKDLTLKNVIILPLFFYSEQCLDIKDCIHAKDKLTSKNKQVIRQAISEKWISMRSNSSVSTHNYLYEDWFYIPKDMKTYGLSCFEKLPQQPFVLVRNAKQLPTFDNRFVGKGFNRIQYVESLRIRGFRFRILSHAYGYIPPRHRVITIDDEKTSERMKKLFEEWYSHEVMYKVAKRTRVCSEKEHSKYLSYVQDLTKNDVLGIQV